MLKTGKRAYLLLEDGTWLRGKAFGADVEQYGEVVFNTGMTGYQEVLSDPSYCGQIVTFTYPLIGNYGINLDDFESMDPAINGIVVKEHSQYPNHWRMKGTLDELLKERGIPGISDIDTRKLTRKIRHHGTMKGMILPDIDEKEITDRLEQLQKKTLPTNQVSTVSTKNAFHCPGNRYRVVLIDFGYKAGILRELTKRQCDVRVVPYDTSASEILRLQPDGVLLSNGPGDPKDVEEGIETVAQIIGKVPVFGICLGHQLFALACGADTEKMKFGHRGANHPVKDIESNKVFLTSQNHGYSVSPDSLSGTRLKVTQKAVNDQSIEGLKHLDFPAFSIQYHPEASPGPQDTNALFDQFMTMMEHQQETTNQKGEKKYATL